MNNNIRFGQQTYAWIMCGDKYMGKIDHMSDITNKAGFEAIEPINLQLGEYYHPEKLKEALSKNSLELSSMTVVCDWLGSKETDEEKAESDRLIDLTATFPGAKLMLVQMPQADRSNLEEKQKNLILNINEISRRATDKGLICTYHPNSPSGSVWRTREDYDKLLPLLDESVIKWTPDVGHIAKDGMDPVQLIREYRSLVNHIHFKDMYENGDWALTGDGCIDFETIVKDLIKTDYKGWIIFEDECEAAVGDPDGITIKDGQYIQNTVKGWLAT